MLPDADLPIRTLVLIRCVYPLCLSLVFILGKLEENQPSDSPMFNVSKLRSLVNSCACTRAIVFADHRKPARLVGASFVVAVTCLLIGPTVAISQTTQSEVDGRRAVVNIANRLELFVDRFLIDHLDRAQLVMHRPVLSPSDNPPSTGHYATIIQDGEKFRMYNRGGYSTFDGDPEEYTAYFESDNGIDWSAPSLGLYEINGSRDNNVVFDEAPFSHNFSPFLDNRKGVATSERYKALAGTKESGLVPFVSADGLNWRKLSHEPVITEGMFDSQNVSFWSESEQLYVCYFRTWTGDGYTGLRTISRSTSPDFLEWSEPVAMNPNAEGEHLYTSGTHPYFRAPHIYLALATRFQPDRAAATDILLMTSRGGDTFDRTFMEAFIPPGLDSLHWANRANYAAVGVIPTSDTEMSVYVRGRRYVLRTDGFASVRAGYEGGSMTTRPLIFEGTRLELNIATSASGIAIVELLDSEGNVLPGFSRAEADPIIGNAIQHTVTWQSSSDVSALAGKPIRIRFLLEDADLYSLTFR